MNRKHQMYMEERYTEADTVRESNTYASPISPRKFEGELQHFSLLEHLSDVNSYNLSRLSSYPPVKVMEPLYLAHEAEHNYEQGRLMRKY